MADAPVLAPSLSAGFPPATDADWRALVDKTLGEAPFSSLEKTTVEGLAIEPLYAPAAAPAAPTREVPADRAWEVATLTAHPDPARANAELLADLRGGAAAAVVRIDPTGETGTAIGSDAALARALDGVILELAPVALDAGFLGPQAADWLSAAAKASPAALLRLHLDPLSAFAETGASPGPIEAHLIAAANVAARLAETYPAAQLFLACGRTVHEAGGGEAGEVAFAAAAAVAYARALVRAGLPMAAAFGRITLGLSADADYFVTIAKLRAARAVWARIARACGADPVARIEARTSRRMLTAKDAWSNMIRLTAAGFGAAVGGADTVVLGHFTDALGLPTEFARRQSRNTQLVLMEEAHIGRVADPAAGSGYVEALTDEIARAAWADFQAIEAAGGIVAALTAGQVARAVDAAKAARPEPRIVGVTAFPPAKDTPVEVEIAAARPAGAPSARLPGPDSACPPLTPMRLSEAFE
ncbi:MAG TPA: methylmalonyl-CoA mutase family protein [Phenylobacterium sp.]|jgi:methylmalonyl-CoA mutase|uniref:methylmalonyl-CoA mutase family protein n=1 Tax=Phenylobacterium sp. TaxID=1871053 RepID=UPI002D1211FE|nr:methylmalonyl-CoA mutase family protein [Phenylobacterium sp.]HXA39871.1 methylmalonyl-CoA mutase family protein [Phenylobacterium sp.]